VGGVVTLADYKPLKPSIMAQLKVPLQFTESIGNFRSYYDKRLKRYILSTAFTNSTMDSFFVDKTAICEKETIFDENIVT
jgi:hypothetical protein